MNKYVRNRQLDFQAKRIIITLGLIFINITIFAQLDKEMIGKVIDQQTGQVLPFVNIVYDSQNQLGTITDIDGQFKINHTKSIDQLELSCLGYQKQIFKPTPNQTHLKIYLQPETFTLSAVEVYGQENPAHRIINQAIDHREENKPESLSAYRYETYNKMHFSFDMDFYQQEDTVGIDQYQFENNLTKKDSVIQEIKDFKNTQYLFLMESVSERTYQKPGKIHEKILATKVSGIQNPTFALLGNQMQSFTIYSDYIMVGEKRYLSPLSKNSIHKYLFLITDTIVHPNTDTTYTLSYQPRKNKLFEGLEGILQINTQNFAVENFSTKPIKQSSYTLTIRQKYECLNHSVWFPTQLDADFIFPDLIKEQEFGGNMQLYGKAKTYIKNINLTPEINRKEFSHIAYEIDDEASQKNEAFWNQYRTDSICDKEQKTYQVIDSLGKAYNFEQKVKFLTYLLSGKIPISLVSIQLDKLMNANVAEGYRLGLGLETNDKLSKNIRLDGYFAYGFRDKKWKYGTGIKFNIRDQFDSNFYLTYQNDVSEIGAIPFSQKQSFFDNLNYREFLIENLFYQKALSASLEMRFFYYLKARAYAQFSKQVLYDQRYSFAKDNNTVSQFEIPEVALSLRYAFREYFVKTPLGIRPLKTDYPIIYLNIAKSLVFEDYPLDYTKIWAKIDKHFPILGLGVTTVSLLGGYAWGDLPYHKLFNGQGSYYRFSILAHNSFGAMRFNEFASDRFAYLFIKHNFGKILYENNWSAPELILVQNIGWGDYQSNTSIWGTEIQTMNKGYIESGLVLNNLIKWDYLRYGLGVFYRYGAYALDKPIDNFAFKLSLGYSF